jgi:hypothetical protein
MYLPEKMIPFLTHEDQAVRGFALRYLVEAGDPSPATADDIWRSIDRFGYREPGLSWASKLPDLPATDTSTGRLLDVLERESDFDVRYDLLKALQELELPRLKKNWERIGVMPQIPDHVLVDLLARVTLFETEPQELWRRLHDVADALDSDSEDPDDLEGPAANLMEALALHPEFTSPKVIEALRDHGEAEARFEFYVELAGRLRLPEAVDEAIWRLRPEQGDWVNEAACDALGRIGTIEVIEKLAAAYPTEGWGFRLSVTDILARIKRPESELAATRLLGHETDEELRSFLAISLCSLCPTEPGALETLRQMILDGRYFKSIVDLRDELSVVADLTGYAPPELPEWREHAITERARVQKSVAALMEKHDRAYRKLWVLKGSRRGEEAKSEEPDEPFDPELYKAPVVELAEPSYAPTAPIRRESPKVGRNDPCPCGSGKKYKKCCGANA